MLEEDQRRAATPTVWPSHQTGTHSQTQERDCLCDEALWEAKEAHQWTLEAAHMLELNIERLHKKADGARCQHPHSHSCSHFQGRSLERCMTFHEPGEGAPSDERPQTELQEHLTRGQLEEGDLGPPPTQRPELEHFLEMPMTSQGMRGRQGYLSEPSIKNYELWLGWWACQLDTPHWWEELTAILEAGDIKTLAQKICTSFDIPVVQCGALRNQNYTAPQAPKCLRRGMFLPDDSSYQDVH